MFTPRVELLRSVVWSGEDNVEFNFEGSSWMGSKRKDFWHPDAEWEKILIPGVELRLWTIQWSLILGFEYGKNVGGSVEWIPVWCAVNNFQTKAEREASSDAYVKAIEDEAKALTKRVDSGMGPEEATGKFSEGLTGNMVGWAVTLAVRDAKNRDAAERLRRYWNKKYGVSEEKDNGGVVNPAVLTIGTKEN